MAATPASLGGVGARAHAFAVGLLRRAQEDVRSRTGKIEIGDHVVDSTDGLTQAS